MISINDPTRQYLTPKFFLGGKISPGTVLDVQGHDAPDLWDVQRRKGSSGAETKHNGRDLRKPSIVIYLVDDSAEGGTNDFKEWDSFQGLIDSMTSGITAKALSIYHPDLARNKITEVSRANVSGFKYDGLGGATVTITLTEYRPPQKKRVAAALAQGNIIDLDAVATESTDPNAAARIELNLAIERFRKA